MPNPRTNSPTDARLIVAAMVAAIAILAALSARERSGRGGVVEVPMFETMAAFNLVEHLYGGHFEPPLGRPGYPRVLAGTRAPFPTLDGFISVMPYTDRHWTDLFKEVGTPSMLEDLRFEGIAARTRNIGLLYEQLAEIIATRSTSDWVDILGRLDIPAAPVIGLDELVHDEHLEQTDFFHELSDEGMGHMRFPGVPVRFDGVRPGIGMPPRLGEHTVEVLAAAGLTSAEIEQLLSTGAAFQHTFDQVDRASARYEEFGGAHV